MVSISSKKVLVKKCYVCGREFPEEDNFCPKHDELVKLAYIDDLVMYCPACKRKYPSDYNFCTFHDEAIRLYHVNDLVKYCPACGRQYPNDYNYCCYCEWDESLQEISNSRPKRDVAVGEISVKPNRYYNFKTHSNRFETVEELLSEVNIEKLENFSLTYQMFESILENIRETYKTVLNEITDQYSIDVKRLNVLDKVLLFAKCFVEVSYKDSGGDMGYYMYNQLVIDDRAPVAFQITTIIHELSHFLLSEILEEIIQLLLDSYKTDAIEAYVNFILFNDSLNLLVDEYCAHTVEGRFAVFGYQDYSSYKQFTADFINDYGEDYLSVANEIGNTFAVYIKEIITSFIDDDLREEIKAEFSNVNDIPQYNALLLETDKVLSWDAFSNVLKLMISDDIREYIASPENIDKLKSYEVQFKKFNNR